MADTAAFLRYVEKGLGRAALILMREDPAPYREALLAACVEDVGHYTAWSDESRAPYLFDLISLTGDPALFRAGLMQALRNPPQEQDHHDRELIFGLLRRLARPDDDEVREAMYSAFSRLPYEDRSALELVRFDGLRGMLFAEEHLVRSAREDLDWDRYELFEAFEEKTGGDHSMEALAASAPWVTAASALAKRIRLQESTRQPRPHLTYEEIKLRISDDARQAGFGAWGEYASAAELLQAAEDLLVETDPTRLCKYLRIFEHGPFPLNHVPLLKLAHHSDEKVALAAVMALSQITHPDVRVLAEEFTSQRRHAEAINLMARNYQEGDWSRIEKWIDVEAEADDYHVLGFAAQHFIESNFNPTAAPSLILLYEHGACDLCRGTVVKHLLTLNLLPDWMREECRYDANDDIRKLMDAKTPAPAE